MPSRRTVLCVLAPALVALAVASLWLVTRLLSLPGAIPPTPVDPGAGLRFQHGVAELLLRQGGLSRRSEPVVFTGPEITAFLAQHVDPGRRVLWPSAVRIEAGWIEVTGRAPLGRLLQGGPIQPLGAVLPSWLLDREVWVLARGRLGVRDGRGELLVDDVAIGRQRVPPGWLWRVLGVRGPDLLTWRLPRIVERVELEPGRLLVHTRR